MEMTNGVCQRCGSVVREGVRFCPNCGQQIVQVVQPIQQPYYQPPPNKSSRKIIAGVIVLLLVIVAIGAAIFLPSLQEDSLQNQNHQNDQSDQTTDSDGDGVPDYWEDRYDWNKNNDDTDGDGILDGDDIRPLNNVKLRISFDKFTADTSGEWYLDEAFTECDSYYELDVRQNNISIDSWQSSVVDNNNYIDPDIREWTYDITDDYSRIKNTTFHITVMDSDNVPPDDELDIGIYFDDFNLWVTYIPDQYSYTIMYHDSDENSSTYTAEGEAATLTYTFYVLET